MDVDESFAEYVAARWSMLYRLAALLVGEDGADDLTQAALVHAYLAWPEVQESASADDRLKAILATTAVRVTKAPLDPPAEGAPGAPQSGRQRLWAGIAALPPRQRAVLVLRHYERLSDAEIGRTVRSSTAAVTAEAGALETGVDLADLRDELFRRAEDVSVPPAPIDDLLEQGHRARRSRVRRATTRTVAVAAALVLGLVVATFVQGRLSEAHRSSRQTGSASDVPQFLGRLPRGRPADIAYTERHFLHLPGGRGTPLNGRPAAIIQTPQYVFVAFLSGEVVRVNPSTAGVQTYVPASGGQLATGPDDGQVAWLESATGPAVVHLEATDPADFTGTVDRQRFPATLRCCDNPFRIDGITRGGELIASLPAESRAWVWDTRAYGGGVREISGLGNGVISQVTASGIVVHYPPLQYAFGQLQQDAFLQISELVAMDADFSDPLGHRVVYADASGSINVREQGVRGRSRRAGSVVTMRLPQLDDGFAGVRWEDTEHVLLDVYDASMPDGALVRCDVRDGACELADDFEGPHLLPR